MANKYYNKKIVIDGILFASKAEGKRYVELKLLQKVGEIVDLRLQPKYVLQEGFVKNGKKFRPITYTADFEYKTLTEVIAEDVKSTFTSKLAVFGIKKKLFEYKYRHIRLVEVLF